MTRDRRGGYLRSGDWVEIRSAEEILSTLDDQGELDSLPFMPEMLRLCGRRARVSQRADKTCDRIEKKGLRRMVGAVHLEGLRCDGADHDGCQAGCLLFWKESWLKPVAAGPRGSAGTPAPVSEGGPSAPASERTEFLRRATRRGPRPGQPDGVYFRCQATELNRATTPLPHWDLRQYYRDVRSGNVKVRTVLWWAVTVALNGVQRIRGTFRLVNLLRGPFRIPHFKGRLTRTPKQLLDLQPGDLVRVKSMEEIVATLDARDRNRGLSFDVEMLKYCGGVYRVLRRVERLIDEPSGRLVHVSSDCIILENVVCEAHYHSFCPKAIYPYWREIWLERVGK